MQQQAEILSERDQISEDYGLLSTSDTTVTEATCLTTQLVHMVTAWRNL